MLQQNALKRKTCTLAVVRHCAIFTRTRNCTGLMKQLHDQIVILSSLNSPYHLHCKHGTNVFLELSGFLEVKLSISLRHQMSYSATHTH